MDPSDIRYILALAKRQTLLHELQQIVVSLLAMTSRLSSLRHSMRTQEMDLRIPESDSSNLLWNQVAESLSLGKVSIERLLSEYYTLPMRSAATTSGYSTTKSSPQQEPARDSTSRREE